MYAKHFGLRDLPFNNTPDPRFFYPTPDHEEALATLVYAVSESKGFVLLTGEVGTGKTLVSRLMLRHFQDRIAFATVNHSCESAHDLISLICAEFDIAAQPNDSTTQLIHRLQNFLLGRFALNTPVVLLLDEAHNLPRDAFELLRTIGNLEADDAKLLQIVILGQPELRRRFQAADMRQLRQRLFRSFHLPALTREQCTAYIRHRLHVAGGQNVFDEAAIEAVHGASRGLPRLINTICDNAMLAAYSADRTTIDGPFMETAIPQMMPAEVDRGETSDLDESDETPAGSKRRGGRTAAQVHAGQETACQHELGGALRQSIQRIAEVEQRIAASEQVIAKLDQKTAETSSVADRLGRVEDLLSGVTQRYEANVMRLDTQDAQIAKCVMEMDARAGNTERSLVAFEAQAAQNAQRIEQIESRLALLTSHYEDHAGKLDAIEETAGEIRRTAREALNQAVRAVERAEQLAAVRETESGNLQPAASHAVSGPPQSGPSGSPSSGAEGEGELGSLLTRSRSSLARLHTTLDSSAADTPGSGTPSGHAPTPVDFFARRVADLADLVSSDC